MSHTVWHHLTQVYEQNKDGIIEAGTLPLLLALARADKPSVVWQAAYALWALARGSQMNDDAINAAGTVTLLPFLSRLCCLSCQVRPA